MKRSKCVDYAAGRGEDLPHETFWPRLADVFRLDAIGRPRYADSDSARSSGTAEQTLM
jgi:hypothetical protein